MVCFLNDYANISNSAHRDFINGVRPIRITGSYAPHFTVYSLTMSSLIAPLAMFFVIVCILGYVLFCTFYKKKDKVEKVAESGKAEEGESQDNENL